MGTNLTATEVSEKEQAKSKKLVVTQFKLLLELIDGEVIEAFLTNALALLFSIIGIDTVDLDFDVATGLSTARAASRMISALQAIGRSLRSKRGTRLKSILKHKLLKTIVKISRLRH